MHRRTYLLVTMVLMFTSFILGCGSGGGSGSGGSSTTTTGSSTTTMTTVPAAFSLVGTWDQVGWTGGSAIGTPPDQMIFNAGGTGSMSGTRSGSATFTWSVSGNTLTLNVGGSPSISTITWIDSNNIASTMPLGGGPSSGHTLTMRRR
jgi:hypothetical protein